MDDKIKTYEEQYWLTYRHSGHLRENYEINVVADKALGGTWAWERALVVKDRLEELEKKNLEKITDDEWLEYCWLQDIMGILVG